MQKPIVEEFENGELKTVIDAEKAELLNGRLSDLSKRQSLLRSY